MIDRKKPGVAFWATVLLVGLPLLYVASFGPACWTVSRADAGASTLPFVYKPLTWSMSKSNGIKSALGWYAQLAAPDGWRWISWNDGTEVWDWSQLPPPP